MAQPPSAGRDPHAQWASGQSSPSHFKGINASNARFAAPCSIWPHCRPPRRDLRGGELGDGGTATLSAHERHRALGFRRGGTLPFPRPPYSCTQPRVKPTATSLGESATGRRQEEDLRLRTQSGFSAALQAQQVGWRTTNPAWTPTLEVRACIHFI